MLAHPQDYTHLFPVFEKPVFILGCPRSGTTALFEALKRSEELYALPLESHHIWEFPPENRAQNRPWGSDRLTARELTAKHSLQFRILFMCCVDNSRGQRYLDQTPRPSRVRLLEKTPKNCLRVPYLNAAFPDAQFILLKRNGRETVASMMENWLKSPYSPLPLARQLRKPDSESPWRTLCPDGWRDYVDRPLEEVCAFQYASAYSTLLDDLASFRQEGRVFDLFFEDLVAQPYVWLRKVCQFAEVPWERSLEEHLQDGRIPLSSSTVTKPLKDKWKKYQNQIERTLPHIAPIMARLGYSEP